MKILFITNLYPTEKSPDYGVFTKEQIDHIIPCVDEHKIIFINSRELGVMEYFRWYGRIKSCYQEYDLIHCFHGLTLVTVFLATRKKPILVSFLNALENESITKSRLINWILIKIFKLILLNNRVYPLFKDKLPENSLYSRKSFYLPNGVNLENFIPIDKQIACNQLGIPANYNYVLFVSSKSMERRQKRYDIYKRTIELLSKKSPDLNIKPLIMSNVPREKCIYYFNAASVYLLTSDFEGSPNAVKEAMSCNTPVVSTDVGNVKEMIEGAKNCFIADQDPEILASFVKKSLESPFCDLREVLKHNGLTVEYKTKELYGIYETILNGQKQNQNLELT